jgi:transposase
MARTGRIDAQRLDLGGFEAWLRAQLVGPALAAVLTAVLHVIRALVAQNTQLRLRILGRRPKPPSERLAALERQLAFGFDVPGNDVAPAASSGTGAQDEPTPDARARRPRGKRQPLPKHLAVVEVPNDVPAAERICGDCGVEMTTVAHRRTTVFELHPARVVLQQRCDETVACPKCDAIVCARAPFAALDAGLLGPTLVTEALCDKVLDGMPIERQARRYQRQGVPIAASTLGRSVGSLLDLLVPIAARVAQRVKHSARLQLDSTGLRVLDRTAPTGTWRDTLWVLVGDGRWVQFAALHDGDGDALEALIAGAEAESFQCDGTGTTNFVEKKWHRCRPGCHSHARRKLVEAVRCGDFRALDAVRLYRRLFTVEHDADGLSPTERLRLRQLRSAPILEQLRDWVVRLAPAVEPKSPLGVALTYLQRQWMRLSLFLLDGEIEVTNNRSERELRPWILGQHGWLFMGDQRNAERWAAAFTLVHTALAHGVNPRAYLHAVVDRLRAGHPHTQLDALLPDALLRAQPALADPLRKTVAPPAPEPAPAPEPEPRAA